MIRAGDINRKEYNLLHRKEEAQITRAVSRWVLPVVGDGPPAYSPGETMGFAMEVHLCSST
jgi:hypothetical protein